MEKDVTIAATLLAAATRQGPLAGAVLAQLRDGLARLGTDADLRYRSELRAQWRAFRLCGGELSSC